MITAYTYTSPKSGKNLLITGAIHGDEPCGTLAIQQLIQELETGKTKLNSGSLTLIPICNPCAYDANKRYIEKNLNRVFTTQKNPESYEEMLANELTHYVDQCDVLLDIHSAAAAGPPNVFQDYITPKNQQLALSTYIPCIIQGRPEIYASETDGKSYDTIGYAHSMGKQGVLIECGQHTDTTAAQIGYRAIRGVMDHIHICPYIYEQTQQTITICMDTLIRKTKPGSFVQQWKHAQYITAGTCIAIYDDGNHIFMPYDGYIVLPNDKLKIGEERFYLGK